MNTKTKHTPGPWRIAYDGRGNPVITAGFAADPVTQARHVWVTTLAPLDLGPLWYRIDEAEREANAHLIAAAPQLLAALRVFCEVWESGEEDDWRGALDDVADVARAAIRKAEGGTP